MDKFETIFNYGESGDNFYIIVKGEVQICTPRHEEEVKLISRAHPSEVEFPFSLERVSRR